MEEKRSYKKIIILFVASLIVCLYSASALAISYGDVDKDGKVTAADARTALRFSVNLEKPEGIQDILADIDKDGKVTAADARMILRMSVNLEDKIEYVPEETTTLPAETTTSSEETTTETSTDESTTAEPETADDTIIEGKLTFAKIQKSAYSLAVEQGFKGTLDEWLASLVGPAGKDGENGKNGLNGNDGKNGKSAYELACDIGFNGSVEQWLASLVGPAGADGKTAYAVAVENGYTGTVQQWLASLTGKKGADGKSAYEIAKDNGYEGTEIEWLRSLAGVNGKSAYEIAVSKGYSGTEDEWLSSLIGKNGTDGKSAYEIAVEKGYKGSAESWLASLVGAAGEDGKSAYELAKEKGFEGTQEEWLKSFTGKNGKSAYEIALENGFVGDEKAWLASLTGAKGEQGIPGKSAYDIAVENGYTGTEKEWIDSLSGKNGADGKSAYELAVEKGYKGTEEEWLSSLIGTKGDKGENGADGKDGQNGKDGVSVTGAHIDEKMHLILELSDGTTIDAGYVGVNIKPEIEKFTVTFYDYDGVTVLKTEQVEKGKAASAPATSVRAGYRFTGWDKKFDSVSADISVKAQYVRQYNVIFKDWDGKVLSTQNVDSGAAAIAPAEPARTGYIFSKWSADYSKITMDTVIVAEYIKLSPKNNFIITYVDNGDSTVTVKVSLGGEQINYAGMEGNIAFDTSKLEYVSKTKLINLAGDINLDKTDNKLYFAFAGSEDYKTKTDLFTVTFRYKENLNTNLDMVITDIYNQNFESEEYTVIGGSVVIE